MSSKINLKGEMDEFQRLSQDLSRDENINISVDEIVDAFKKSKEETLTNDIWSKLENTESNTIEKGDYKSVKEIAKKYNKTNPKLLAQSLRKGDYNRPLILNIGERYILVAGNTRLCTAAAIGLNPFVHIAKINKNMNENNIKGGLSDNKTLEQIAKKHSKNGDINNILTQLKIQLIKGVNVEMEHTNNKKIAKEIAMDHLYEDPNYYTKLKKIEAHEMTGADSSGSFEASFSSQPIKRKITKIHNSKNVEMKEATLSDSSGQYDASFSAGRKDPLAIEGPKSIKKSRAVRDKNFPKWGGPDSVYVQVKEKCKKFPYCNQGDIKALEMFEINGLNEAIDTVSKKHNVSRKTLESIVLEEIKKII